MEGNDESLYCHGNLIIPLIKRGMMSDYAHVNHASVRAGTHGELLVVSRKHTVNFWLVNRHFCIHVSIVHRVFS